MPARFRDVIFASNDDKVMITNFQVDSTPCLDVYPQAAWLRVEERMSKRAQFHPKVQAFTRYYFSSVQECQLDKQGRLLLPPQLRAHAKLGDSVVFTGAAEKFQVWDQSAWQRVYDTSKKTIFDDPDFFKDFDV